MDIHETFAYVVMMYQMLHEGKLDLKAYTGDWKAMVEILR